jgi:DNA gyrase subunit B
MNMRGHGESMKYDKDSIIVLNDVEHIRKRPGMYIGDGENPHHLFSEALDNAIDEVQSGYGTCITVIVDTDKNEYQVIDDGRGIPHGTKVLDNGEEVEIVKLICTRANSGGKFTGDSYAFAGGLHGLGTTIINALSSHLVIESTREGQKVSYIAHKDKVVREKVADKNMSGTTIKFIPNPKYFKSPVIPLDFIIQKCRIANAFGVKTYMKVCSNGTIEEINVDATMSDLIPKEEGVTVYHEFPLILSNKSKYSEHMELLLVYTSDTKDKYYGYTNMIYNRIGGTHVNIVSTQVISNAWEEFIRRNKIKTEVELHRSDFLVGLRCVVAVFLKEPSFSSQTKEKLTTPKEALEIFGDRCQRELVRVLCEAPEVSRALLKRFEEYRISQNKLLARKEISSLIRVNNDSPDNIRRRSIVPKLIECTSKSRKDTELYILEGDSAVGPAARVRNKEFQAVLPLRGKILNVTNMTPKQAVKSQEVCNIVNAIGCGIGSQCDSSKSRYDRIIINGDADPDGYQIVCLVLSVFVNFLPDIVRDGRLYIVQPPLYGWRDKSGLHFTNNRAEIPDGVKFTRYKGLGEFDDDEYLYCCMDPKTRKLIKVDYPSDIDEFNRILGTSAGKSQLLEDLGIMRILD